MSTDTTTDLLAPDPDDIVVVPVYCQARHAAAVQRHAVDFLATLTHSPESGYQPPFKSSDGPENPWDLPPWNDPTDEPAGRWILGVVSDAHRHILGDLLAAGDEGVTVGTLLVAAGYSPGTSGAGVFKAIAGRFRRVGRRPVWDGAENTEDRMRLFIPESEGRDLFTRVLRDDHPDIAAAVGL